jgi:hypothetical protein
VTKIVENYFRYILNFFEKILINVTKALYLFMRYNAFVCVALRYNYKKE